MTKKEQAYFRKQLNSIANDVSYTPVDCGVKRQALEKLENLLEVLKKGIPKPPPKPKMEPWNRDFIRMLKAHPLTSIKSAGNQEAKT